MKQRINTAAAKRDGLAMSRSTTINKAKGAVS